MREYKVPAEVLQWHGAAARWTDAVRDVTCCA